MPFVRRIKGSEKIPNCSGDSPQQIVSGVESGISIAVRMENRTSAEGEGRISAASFSGRRILVYLGRRNKFSGRAFGNMIN